MDANEAVAVGCGEVAVVAVVDIELLVVAAGSEVDADCDADCSAGCVDGVDWLS